MYVFINTHMHAQETLPPCLLKLTESFGLFFTEADVRSLLSTFLDNISSASVSTRRSACDCAVAVCQNSREPFKNLSVGDVLSPWSSLCFPFYSCAWGVSYEALAMRAYMLITSFFGYTYSTYLPSSLPFPRHLWIAFLCSFVPFLPWRASALMVGAWYKNSIQVEYNWKKKDAEEKGERKKESEKLKKEGGRNSGRHQ